LGRVSYEDDGEARSSIEGLSSIVGLSAGVPGDSITGACDSRPGVVGLDVLPGDVHAATAPSSARARSVLLIMT
jgi:hypothetical protein